MDEAEYRREVQLIKRRERIGVALGACDMQFLFRSFHGQCPYNANSDGK
jgi:hypothetical protein